MKQKVEEFFIGYRYWPVWLILAVIVTAFFIYEMNDEGPVVPFWIILVCVGWLDTLRMYARYRQNLRLSRKETGR
jgi:hypothetical protein